MSLFLTMFMQMSFAEGTFSDTFDIRHFRPSSDAHQYFAVPSASTLRHLQMGISLGECMKMILLSFVEMIIMIDMFILWL